jgi:hypothetical protein
MGDKLDDSEKAAVQAKIDETKEALKGEDIEKIKVASEGLQQEIYKISEKVYKAAQEAAAAGQAAWELRCRAMPAQPPAPDPPASLHPPAPWLQAGGCSCRKAWQRAQWLRPILQSLSASRS